MRRMVIHPYEAFFGIIIWESAVLTISGLKPVPLSFLPPDLKVRANLCYLS